MELVVPNASLSVVAASALVTHLWFKKREPTSFTPLFLGLVVVPGLTVVPKLNRSTLTDVFVAYTSFYVLLLMSIVTYRLSPLHPLAGYPGPRIARITKFWGVWKTIDGKLPQYYRELHAQYGSIVRIGPNELSVVDKDLLPQILGTQGMPRGPLWEGRRVTPTNKSKRDYNVILQRDSARHLQLRRPWNKAFSNEPLLDYGESVVKKAAEFVEILERKCLETGEGRVGLDMAKWIDWFSFDFMGELVFGKGFDILQTEDKDHFQENMQKGLTLPAYTQHIPWSTPVLRRLPFTGDSMRVFGNFAVERAMQRASQDVKRKDLFYHLVNNALDEETSPMPFIVSNAVLAIVGGSDTTASALSGAIYYLLSNPAYIKLLRKELETAFPPLKDGTLPLELEKLGEVALLDAIINETLRLQPPIPTGLQRAPERNSGGRLVGTHFIHEDTAILVPPYVLHRDPRYFWPKPDTFWPERWIEYKNNSDIVLETSVFVPFSSGPANCAGKRLAMLELRFVLASLVSRFDMRFAPGWDVGKWEECLLDRFMLAKGELMAELSPRAI